MPCRDPWYDDGADARKRLDAATKAACELAKWITKENTLVWPRLSKETKDWIREHQKQDRKAGRK